jgi:hypothetical protein
MMFVADILMHGQPIALMTIMATQSMEEMAMFTTQMVILFDAVVEIAQNNLNIR